MLLLVALACAKKIQHKNKESPFALGEDIRERYRFPDIERELAARISLLASGKESEPWEVENIFVWLRRCWSK